MHYLDMCNHHLSDTMRHLGSHQARTVPADGGDHVDPTAGADGGDRHHILGREMSVYHCQKT